MDRSWTHLTVTEKTKMTLFFMISIVFVYRVYSINVLDVMKELDSLKQEIRSKNQRLDRLQHIMNDLSKRDIVNKSLPIKPFETRIKINGKVTLLSSIVYIWTYSTYFTCWAIKHYSMDEFPLHIQRIFKYNHYNDSFAVSGG